MRIVVHAWTELATPRGFLGLTNLLTAAEQTDADVAIEHHAYLGAPDIAQQYEEFGEELTAHGFTETHPHGNTRRAHELIYCAKAARPTDEEGARAGVEMAMALHRAGLTGHSLDDDDVLARAAAQAGLDPRAALADVDAGVHRGAVDSDLASARHLRLQTQPYLIAAGILAIDGVQSPEDIAEVLGQAAQALREQERMAAAEAEQIAAWHRSQQS
ncbi:MAG: DsbA family protein [Flaviflexus sp.]|nr:DsbA family protein [Flaviflexus sp.]